MNGFADVVINAPSFAHSGNDGGKIVIGQNHVGHIFGYVGAGNPHANADVGVFDGRGVIDAVSGHGGNLAFFAPGVDDSRLVLRLHSRIYGVFFYGRIKVCIADRIKLRARDRFIRALNDPQLRGNGHGRILVVAGDHDGTNPGLPTFVNCLFHFGANGIHHSDKSKEDQIVFQRLCLINRRTAFQPLFGGRQYTQSLVGHGFVGRKDFRTRRVRERTYLPVLVNAGAMLENFIGGSFGKLYQRAIAFLMHGCHHFAPGVEGDFADAHPFLTLLVFVKTKAVRVVHQSTFRRFADGHLLFRIHLRIGAKRHGCGQTRLVRAVMLHHFHFVLRERSGFIRANDLCASQRFHRRHFSDDGISLRHVGYADGKHNRYYCGKAFGNSGHSQGNGDHKGVQNRSEIYRPGAEQGYDKDDPADADD